MNEISLRYKYFHLLAGEEIVDSLFKEDFLNLHDILTSPIVPIELLSFSELSEHEEQAIEDLLSQFSSVL